MKKRFLPIAALAIIVTATSCGGGGFESDVKKMANYDCQIKKLEAKDPTDESAKKEIEKIEKEKTEFTMKMMEKYKDKKDDKDMDAKADKIMDEVMAKCK